MKRGARQAMAVFALVLLSALWPLEAGSAAAKISGCRTDPVVTLSNGKQIAMTASFTDDLTNVSKITYSVNVPNGVSFRTIMYTANAPVTEYVVMYHSNAPNTYTSTTNVSSTSTGVQVSVSTTLKSVSTGATLAYGTNAGPENQSLLVRVTG